MSTTRVTVSPEELARRRMAAARQNLERAIAELESLRLRACAHTTRAGESILIDLPETPTVPRTAEAIEQAANDLRAAVRRADESLESALAAERRAAYEDAFRDATRRAGEASQIKSYRANESIDERPSTNAGVPEVANAPADELQKTLDRVLSRLPDRARSSTNDEVARLVTMVAEASTPRQQERVIDRLRQVVQDEQDAQRRAAENAERVDALLARLDGAPGASAARLRGYLRAFDPTERLPVDIGAQVEDAVKELSDEERQDVLKAVKAWFESEGYDIDGPLAELGDEGILVDHPVSTDHAVLVRQRGALLLLNVVRFDDQLERDPAQDLEAEETVCTDLASLVEHAAGLGINLRVEQHAADGNIQVMDHATGGDRRRSTRRRHRDRARERKRP